LTFEPEGEGTDLNAPLQLVGSVLKRKATLFLVSDFWAGDFRRSLSVVNRRHDCIAVRIRDPREMEIPPVGLVRWVDAENGRSLLVDTSSPQARQVVVERIRNHDAALEKMLLSLHVDLVDIDATRSYVEPLQTFFDRRAGSRRRRS
jgi:uncharacterized protein (DUF58 family)